MVLSHMKANQSGLYILSLIQLRVRNTHRRSPQRPHYPLNFQLFQRQMSTPGISAMNTGDCAILASLTGDEWADDQTVFFFLPIYCFFHIPASKRTSQRSRFLFIPVGLRCRLVCGCG